MKHWLFFLLFFPVLLFGQKSSPEFILKYEIPGSDFKREVIVKGSPFLQEDYAMGKVFIKKRPDAEILMRYNAYEDYFEIFQRGKAMLLTKGKNIEVVFEEETYQFIEYIEKKDIKTGYFTPLNEGETLLYSRTVKLIPDFDFPENGYETFEPPKFLTERQYYIQRKNRPAQKLMHLSRKEVFAILWEKYSELRTYARKNKLNMRTESDVIEVLSYYDSL